MNRLRIVAVGAAAMILSLSAPVSAEIAVTVTVPERTVPNVVEAEPDDRTTLPNTGSDVRRVVGLALTFLLLGLVLVTIKRQREREGRSRCND